MNSQVHTHTHAPRWALMLLALGLAVVVLGTAAGSQGWQAWWTAAFPGAAISLLAMALALTADGVNDFLNPRLRQKS